MNSRCVKALALSLCLCLILGAFAGCQNTDTTQGSTEPSVSNVDYAGSLKLNMDSDTAKQEVTVKSYVDGDTVHFYVPESMQMEENVLKGRFLAVNTPESTGKIEEYGKAASNFTKETLKKATSIIIESDTSTWDADSTGGRYLVWVWYKTAEMTEYRNLNVELLQNGLAIASNTSNNIYGSTAMAALNQARAQKLNVHSGKPDPDMFYGDAVELDLKELRTNLQAYNGVKVAFSGVIVKDDNGSIYVESYDAETDVYYGMAVYYGYNMNAFSLKVLKVGNLARIVGTVQYYETGDSWQVSGLVDVDPYDKQNPDTIQQLGTGYEGGFVLTDPQRFLNGTVEVMDGEETKTLPYAEAALNSSLSMNNLKVVDVYTTPTGNSAGAMTLTCQVDGKTISVRTTVLRNEDGSKVTADAFLGKTIDVKGIVDLFNGTYQIKVISTKDITIHN